MYLINTEVQIDWVLDKTPNTISSVSAVITNPNGDTSFIPATSFTAPTSLAQGSASLLITPDIEGLWYVTLVKGTPYNYDELNLVTLYVFINDTIIQPPSYNPNSLSI